MLTTVVPVVPVETGTLLDRVYREIKRQIMAGAFKPGQTFATMSLAAALGTSTMPVREALRRLETEKALQILPKRAVLIPRMTKARFREITDVRIALEGMASDYAGRRIEDGELRELEDLLGMVEKARKASDLRAYLEVHQEFHFAIYGAARLPVVMPMIESLWLQIGPVYGLLDVGGINLGSECHRLVLDGLHRRDGARARDALARDIALGAEALLNSHAFAEA
ncbi:MAG: GntR family transcriptional regulator [Alphaproteobacteria bacterium]|nr:GntR family transcriptional regulator [Alphaproteobacteria bacterium]